MKIGGFQKLSLLNYPEKTACTVFTAGCNFCCPWCHNSGLVSGEETDIETVEILEYLQKRRGMLEGVCISGGEPTLQKDLPEFLAQVKQLGYAIKLDTNGSDPELIETVLHEKLTDYIAMDIKNTGTKYAETIGLSKAPLQAIRRSMDLLRSGRIPYEFRTTVIAEYHDPEDIETMAKELQGAAVWYLQPFRDAPEVLQKGLHAPDPKQLEVFGSIANRYVMTMIRA